MKIIKNLGYPFRLANALKDDIKRAMNNMKTANGDDVVWFVHREITPEDYKIIAKHLHIWQPIQDCNFYFISKKPFSGKGGAIVGPAKKRSGFKLSVLEKLDAIKNRQMHTFDVIKETEHAILSHQPKPQWVGPNGPVDPEIEARTRGGNIFALRSFIFRLNKGEYKDLIEKGGFRAAAFTKEAVDEFGVEWLKDFMEKLGLSVRRIPHTHSFEVYQTFPKPEPGEVKLFDLPSIIDAPEYAPFREYCEKMVREMYEELMKDNERGPMMKPGEPLFKNQNLAPDWVIDEHAFFHNLIEGKYDLQIGPEFKMIVAGPMHEATSSVLDKKGLKYLRLDYNRYEITAIEKELPDSDDDESLTLDRERGEPVELNADFNDGIGSTEMQKALEADAKKLEDLRPMTVGEFFTYLRKNSQAIRNGNFAKVEFGMVEVRDWERETRLDFRDLLEDIGDEMDVEFKVTKFVNSKFKGLRIELVNVNDLPDDNEPDEPAVPAKLIKTGKSLIYDFIAQLESPEVVTAIANCSFENRYFKTVDVDDFDDENSTSFQDHIESRGLEIKLMKNKKPGASEYRVYQNKPEKGDPIDGEASAFGAV